MLGILVIRVKSSILNHLWNTVSTLFLVWAQFLKKTLILLPWPIEQIRQSLSGKVKTFSFTPSSENGLGLGTKVKILHSRLPFLVFPCLCELDEKVNQYNLLLHTGCFSMSSNTANPLPVIPGLRIEPIPGNPSFWSCRNVEFYNKNLQKNIFFRKTRVVHKRCQVFAE